MVAVNEPYAVCDPCQLFVERLQRLQVAKHDDRGSVELNRAAHDVRELAVRVTTKKQRPVCLDYRFNRGTWSLDHERESSNPYDVF